MNRTNTSALQRHQTDRQTDRHYKQPNRMNICGFQNEECDRDQSGLVELGFAKNVW